ncbi:hypothetical protein EV681_2778 [Advenella incenata]|uniref:Uncharacterized protein n=1 Tax=Advenella incenata TaxID=267800 RepID=A0A4V2FSH7_9BURK|nr:hypothetical protein EV681_2778 [Advenella incenata]
MLAGRPAAMIGWRTGLAGLVLDGASLVARFKEKPEPMAARAYDPTRPPRYACRYINICIKCAGYFFMSTVAISPLK